MHLMYEIVFCLSYLQQADSDRQRNTSGSEWPFTLRDRPRVSLKLSQQICQIHIDSMHRLKKPEYKTHTHVLEKKKCFAFFVNNNHQLTNMNCLCSDVLASGSSILRGQRTTLLSCYSWLC